MDFELNDDQRAILDAVAVLLGQHAGASRAIELGSKAEYDHGLEAALREAGFIDVALGDETGTLEAALVTEAVARAGGVVAMAAATLVAPAVMGRSLPGPIALARVGDGRTGPVRFAGHARTLLVLDGEQARVVTLEAGEAEPVRSNFGYPMARIAAGALARGEDLGSGSGARLVRWWRLAIAVEAVGTMAAALETTVEFVKRRRQFGHAIGSFQAVQHRLAECAVLVEGSRWLAYEAAFDAAKTNDGSGEGEECTAAERAATAAAHATSAAGRVFAETHQLTGAMGFTREHDLHVWSMRLQALRVELDGVSGQRRAVARARWVQKR